MPKEIKSGKYVLRLRTSTKLTQKDFANKINVTRSYISQLETNKINISLTNFIDWCKLFEIEPKEIFDKNIWK